MLLRLILAVMLMLGGVAADAASPSCHDMTAMSGHSMNGHSMNGHSMPGQPMPGDTPAKALPVHNCIGCVPPSNMLPAGVAEPMPPNPAPLFTAVARLDLGRSIPPSLPPPRIG